MVKQLDPLNLNIATTVLRIEQVAGLPHDSILRELLIERLATCDVPRLRKHLTADALALIDEIQHPTALKGKKTQ